MMSLLWWQLVLRPRPDGQGAAPNSRTARRLSFRSGESVVMVAHPSRLFSLPKYLLTIGLYGIWRKRHDYVVTDQRVMIGRGVVVRREWTIPMRRIEAVSFIRRGAGAFCELEALTTRGREVDSVGPLSSRDARRMVSAIDAHL